MTVDMMVRLCAGEHDGLSAGLSPWCGSWSPLVVPRGEDMMTYEFWLVRTYLEGI